MRFFRKMTGTVALVIALAIPLTACGGGNKDTAETTAKTEETVTDDTTETAGDPSTEETTVETVTGEPDGARLFWQLPRSQIF